MYSIVLVEDEKSIRENIQKGILWEKNGFYIVGVAANGEEALELVEKFQPDVLLTDIKMPFMDGLELSRYVKRLFPTIKIVILSGYMEFAYAKEAISLGVEEYIVKPITPVKLIRSFANLKEKMDEEAKESERINSLVRELRNLEDSLAVRSSQKISTQDLNNEGKREAILWDFLQNGSVSEIGEFTDQYVNSCDKGMLCSLMYCSYFFVQTLVTCMRAVENLGGNPAEVFQNIQDVDHYVSRITSPDHAKSEIQDILYQAIKFRNDTVDRYSGLIRTAKKFLWDNYSDVELCVGDVASFVGLSPSHFSCIFKQKTGNGVVKYLTEIRIEKAKELLNTTVMTVAEIAEQVGYSNANYFSAVFRKTTGMTTKEYRESGKSKKCSKI